MTTSVTQGIATAFAGRLTTEICWKSSSVRGVNPSVTTHCSRSIRASRPPSAPSPFAPAANSTPTATKLIQKPACISAQGSSRTTTEQANSQTQGQGQRRPDKRSKATAASIHTVRREGNPQPLNTAYMIASKTPPTSPACCAGHRNISRRLRRQRVPTAAAASQANIVMWSPEIATRCETPVARKTSQSARSIAFWSPVTSAAITPAACRSATRSRIASRTDSRARSIGWRHVVPMRSGRGSRGPART